MLPRHARCGCTSHHIAQHSTSAPKKRRVGATRKYQEGAGGVDRKTHRPATAPSKVAWLGETKSVRTLLSFSLSGPWRAGGRLGTKRDRRRALPPSANVAAKFLKILKTLKSPISHGSRPHGTPTAHPFSSVPPPSLCGTSQHERWRPSFRERAKEIESECTHGLLRRRREPSITPQGWQRREARERRWRDHCDGLATGPVRSRHGAQRRTNDVRGCLHPRRMVSAEEQHKGLCDVTLSAKGAGV